MWHRKPSLLAILVLGVAWGGIGLTACNPQATTAATPADVPAAGPYDEIPSGNAELYLLNASGWTLIASARGIKDNGQTLAKLDRGTFKRVLIRPGSHELESANTRVKLEALERRRYYFVVAYNPAKSWAFPLGGKPMFVGFVPEEQGKELLAQSKEVKEP